MKFLLILLLLEYTSGGYILQQNKKKIIYEDQLLKFDIKLYNTNNSCLKNENYSAHFDLITNCQCYQTPETCFNEIIDKPKFLNYNWSWILNDYNMSYINISNCIVNSLENQCVICENVILNYYTQNNNNICYSIYFIGIVLILLILGICMVGVYFIIKNNRRNGYTSINNPKKYRFFTKK